MVQAIGEKIPRKKDSMCKHGLDVEELRNVNTLFFDDQIDLKDNQFEMVNLGM